MSAFWTTCPRCGERYFHLFVGRTLHSGHDCDKKIGEVWGPDVPQVVKDEAVQITGRDIATSGEVHRQEPIVTVWSRPRIKDPDARVPSRWCFDGLPVGLIGYRNLKGQPLIGPVRACLCEWHRRRRTATGEPEQNREER